MGEAQSYALPAADLYAGPPLNFTMPTPEEARQIMLNPPPPPPVVEQKTADQIDPWLVGAAMGKSFAQINETQRGTDNYKETVFDRLWSGGVSPYSFLRPDRNVESYLVFYEGVGETGTKYYTDSSNIDEFRKLGYKVQKNARGEYEALLDDSQVQNGYIPPTQYVPSTEIPWTAPIDRAPDGSNREINVEVGDPVVPSKDYVQKPVEQVDYKPIAVVGGLLVLYLLTRKNK